jgi:hypothetical protein
MLSADDTQRSPTLSPALEKRLKGDARRLHHAADDRAAAALAELRRLPSLKKLDDDALLAALKRRHALSAVAVKLGFASWQHLVAVVRGEELHDVGTLLYPSSACAFSNVWSAQYEEAAAIRREHGGYLLPYKRQFFICDAHFVAFLGLDPEDPRWARIGRDLVRPGDRAARASLLEDVINARLDV